MPGVGVYGPEDVSFWTTTLSMTGEPFNLMLVDAATVDPLVLPVTLPVIVPEALIAANAVVPETVKFPDIVPPVKGRNEPGGWRVATDIDNCQYPEARLADHVVDVLAFEHTGGYMC